MVWVWILGATALVLALFATMLSVTLARQIGKRDPSALPRGWRTFLRIAPVAATPATGVTLDTDNRAQIAFIVNPTKDGTAELRERAMRACAIRYLPEPMWIYTTEEDPGTGQARDAIEAGADVVVAVGGDGTVRAVAEALAGEDVAMGIIPLGTGNLFARNLDLPLADTGALLRIVIEGSVSRVDVGWLDIERAFPASREGSTHLFLVMAGAGIDAEMVAGADPILKKRLGWMAYFFAAVEHLGDKRIKATVTVDEGLPLEAEMRTVLMANAGRLPGGLQLIPDASVTDGELDIATLDARGGLVGWTELFGSVVAQGAGIKQTELLRTWRTSRIDHRRGQSVTIDMDSPQRVQVDGESLGRASRVKGRIQAGGLLIKVPAGITP
ncbi:diacylglycerol kinase family protein [Demequina sp. NBRC 110055]|uniref:diacylglycerol/lipid kinase family protein n=1 Tax=Demequina sp. NBRC 110055 TaxID=1570344 RepID=UPI0009FCF989|nr:diacylglycerol kinase family protein [Demequina sp. NBRC 110055]